VCVAAVSRFYYFNFEDERLINFTVADFQSLQETFVELFGVQKTYYFDEIQNIDGWERFVRRLYNNGNKIYITGSNATLFSDELGTRLTGRYLPLSVYPFAFSEIVKTHSAELVSSVLSTTQIGRVKKLFNEYYQFGGMPDYVKYQQIEYLHSLYESILYRDIITHYKISNPKPIKELVFYLASNCSKEITFNSLRKVIGVGSVTTVSDYCFYLENSYLCFFVNRYSESVKSQMQSPKKVYFIDHVLAKTVGFHFSEEKGRVLENIVFIELKRRGLEIFYYRDKKECDFLIRTKGKITSAIQVCQHLDSDKTKQREEEGLIEALARYSLKEGYILTDADEAVVTIQRDKVNYKITIMPIWKWLLTENEL
jgi:predicted AAA+ superfamily ATPase